MNFSVSPCFVFSFSHSLVCCRCRFVLIFLLLLSACFAVSVVCLFTAFISLFYFKNTIAQYDSIFCYSFGYIFSCHAQWKLWGTYVYDHCAVLRIFLCERIYYFICSSRFVCRFFLHTLHVIADGSCMSNKNIHKNCIAFFWHRTFSLFCCFFGLSRCHYFFSTLSLVAYNFFFQ